MIGNKELSIVIPAYNEGLWIGEVLDVATSISWIKEVIVVNDGSTDDTADVVRRYPVRLTNLPQNQGKGAALQRGIMAASGDIIIFLDADLVGLNANHVRTLIDPIILDRETVMTIGRFSGGRLSTNLSQRIAPILNGQRALTMAFAQSLPDLKQHRFGVEILISKFAKEKNFKVREVILEGLSQVLKEEKEGILRGTVSRYRMYGELLRTMRRSQK